MAIGSSDINNLANSINALAVSLTEVTNTMANLTGVADSTSAKGKAASKAKKDDKTIGDVLEDKVLAAIALVSAKITEAVTKAAQSTYENIQKRPHEKLEEFVREGAKAGIRYDEKFLRELHSRYEAQGKKIEAAELQAQKIAGIRGESWWGPTGWRRGTKELIGIAKRPEDFLDMLRSYYDSQYTSKLWDNYKAQGE